MIGKHLCVLVAAVLIVSCRSHAVSPSWSYDNNVGLAMVSAEHACLSINHPSLTADSRAHIVDTQRQREISAVVVAGRPACANDAAGMSGYEIRLDAADVQLPFVGIVVVGDGISLVKRGTQLAADLDQDGRDEFFRTCTSAEGVHATVWSDAPLTGTRRWHRYHALGYDVEANCTPAEVKP